MVESRLKEYIDINPTVKLQKGEVYSVVEMEKITVGKKIADANSKAEYTGKSCSKFLPNDTLMARITPCLENGKIAKYESDTPGFGSTEFFILRAKKKKTTADYVYYLSQTHYVRQLAINSMTGASGRQRADAKFIGDIKWNFPEIETQNKVSDILSNYDNLIENNNKRIKLLEKMAENLYKEWFVRFRFPGYGDTEFEDGMPRGWVREKIGLHYNTCSGGTPSRKHEEYYTEGTIPWVKTGEIKDGIIIHTDECITEAGIKGSSAKLLPQGAVVMAMYGVNIGMLAYLDSEMTCNQACCVFNDKNEINSRHYLFHYLYSIRDYLLLIGFGAAQQNLSQDLIKKVKIVIPPAKLIKEFDKQKEPLYQTIRALMMQNDKLIKQRDALLPRLMSGKLEV